jgi:hypothetical protein
VFNWLTIHEQPPSDSAALACLVNLRAAIHAYDVYPCPETAAARDVAALAYLKASGVKDPCVPLASPKPKRLPNWSRP